MKLSQWAKQNGICYLTAYKWFHQGKIPNAYQMDTGTILVNNTKDLSDNQQEKIFIYARVSSNNRKKDLENQIQRCEQFCLAKGLEIQKVYKEIASSMNDNRRELWKLLDQNPTKIIVEHKDRLTRFGFNYLERLLKKQNCEILVIHRDKEDESDLMKDLISIITSFCCRLYGLRKGKNKSKQLKEALNDKNL